MLRATQLGTKLGICDMDKPENNYFMSMVNRLVSFLPYMVWYTPRNARVLSMTTNAIY